MKTKDLKLVSTGIFLSFLKPFSKYKNMYMLYLENKVKKRFQQQTLKL